MVNMNAVDRLGSPKRVRVGLNQVERKVKGIT